MFFTDRLLKGFELSANNFAAWPLKVGSRHFGSEMMVSPDQLCRPQTLSIIGRSPRTRNQSGTHLRLLLKDVLHLDALARNVHVLDSEKCLVRG